MKQVIINPIINFLWGVYDRQYKGQVRWAAVFEKTKMFRKRGQMT